MSPRKKLNIIAAICVSAVILGVLGFGYGTIPALGPALDPGRGVWTSASGGQPVRSQTLDVPGLASPATVGFTAQGAASVSARSTHDLFLALGYVHARFRLTEMDAERRLGEGQLAQLGGPPDLESDEFELRLGLLRTARQEWAQTSGLARQALLAYAQGVNDDIAQVRSRGDWPAVFSLPGVYPRPWAPVDSLVIQGVLTQELDLTSAPLDYALLERSLGAARTMDWFPVIAPNAQSPFVPGPYGRAGVTPLAPDAASSLPPGSAAVMAGAGGGRVTTARSVISGGEADAARSLLAELSRLP
ncbi:MAG: penicillin acylase family protein, partial [Streptosporangiaceae bacterium]|nr:penicillin acylase family protein [Streptosporangiaceae bacterium]